MQPSTTHNTNTGTDTTLSPDGRFLVYATIAPTAYLVHVGGPLDAVESLANVTEIHDGLDFTPRRADSSASADRSTPGGGGAGGDEDGGGGGGFGSFGIWSLSWGPDNREIVAGTSDSAVCVFDVESGRTAARLLGHQDDVNAVCHLDSCAPHLVASGSDDATIKVWDRRLAGAACRRPVGVLLGHTEGLTHLSARGDGR